MSVRSKLVNLFANSIFIGEYIMGGQNHQPCRKYLAISTFMSRAASSAFLELQHANIALEDLLLAELNDKVGSVDDILQHLNKSSDQLLSLHDTIQKLRAKMDVEGYKDLPPLRRLDLHSIGSSLAETGVLQESAWNEVSQRMKSGTFYGVLNDFQDNVLELKDLTAVLKHKITDLSEVAQAGTMMNIVETNQPGNFKVEFAMLYTAWNNFQMKFLAFALLSTEVYYAFNGYGSLTSDVQIKVAV